MDTSSEARGEHGEPVVRTAVAAPARVLVAYATRHGSTSQLAEWIAEEVREAGAEVDVAPVTADPSPGDYHAVVLGGPMILGWHKDGRRFLKRHAGELAGRPTALFVTCASLTETGEERIDGVTLTKDPWLVKEPRTAGKLSYRENYATPRHYLEDVLEEAPDLHPVNVAFFGGSLDLTKMNLFEKLFVTLAIRATPGDARNQEAVRGWARQVVAELLA